MKKKSSKSLAGKTETELNNINEEARDFIKCVIEGLGLGNGEFLLAVAWVTEEAQHFHSLYPDILGFDVVFGTNTEKRPLMRGTGKSSSNKNLPIINAFLPNEKQWIFDWFFNDAVPSCLSREALKHTKLILTDGDKDMYAVIDQALQNVDKLFGNARRRTCAWHVVSMLNLFEFFCTIVVIDFV